MSMFEIMSGKGNKCNEQLRSEEARLAERARLLEQQVSAQQRQYDELQRQESRQKALNAAQQREIRTLDAQIATERDRLAQLQGQVTSLRTQIEQSQSTASTPAQEAELVQLQRDVDVLTRSINRLLASRAQAAARNQ
jgi:chromosome segregation ATPase